MTTETITAVVTGWLLVNAAVVAILWIGRR